MFPHFKSGNDLLVFIHLFLLLASYFSFSDGYQ